MRILVTGNAGSGKSTLAKEIATQLRIPFYSLDKFVWQEGWKKTPKNVRSKQITKLIAKENWIIDGVDHEIQDAADVTIFLDFSRRICFWRTAKRNKRYLFKSRPELPPGCPEILIIPTLCKIIWRFPNRVRPNIIARKNSVKKRGFIHIQSNSDLKQLSSNYNGLLD